MKLETQWPHKLKMFRKKKLTFSLFAITKFQSFYQLPEISVYLFEILFLACRRKLLLIKNFSSTLHPLKTSENQIFSDVFRRQRNVAQGQNELIL